MGEVIVYHNPRCTKSRQTLELLERRGEEPGVIEYLKNPPSVGDIRDILTKLGMTARELMRKNESEYKDNGLDDPALSEDDLIEALVKYPRLIERPIVLANGKAAIGRPPENVEAIL